MAHRSTLVKVQSLVHAWLVLDFFGDARRTGAAASTLTTTIFSQSFLCLVVAALLYPEPPPVAFAAANLSLSTLLVALSALDVEPAAARTQADRALLATAPLSRAAATIARAAHGTFHLALLTVGMALPAGILLACRESNPLLLPGYVALAVLCATIATGLLDNLLTAVRILLGDLKAALVAGTVKALMLGLGFALFAMSLGRLEQTADALPIGRTGAELLPTYHAARLLTAPTEESWRLVLLLALVLLPLVLQSLLQGRERERPARVRGPGLLARAATRFAGTAPDRAITAFCATMLWRSSGLRARVLPLLGVPAAMAALAMSGSEPKSQRMLTAMALQFPAIYLPFVIAFLPHADQPGCRWVFDSSPDLAMARIQRASWLALVCCVLLPVQIAACALLLAAGQPATTTLAAASFAVGFGGLAARLMVRDLADLPFSRDQDQEEGLEFGNLLGYALALAIAGAGTALLTEQAALALGLLSVLALYRAMTAKPPQHEHVA